MCTRSKLLIETFRAQERGSVAILFSLMSAALLLLAGMALDYSRINDAHTRLASAVDSASLAAGRAMLDGKLTDDEVIELAGRYFDANVKNTRSMGIVGKPDIKIDRESGTVDINVTTDVAMTVSRVGGFTTMAVPVASEAVYKQKDIEVGMALDITGSMSHADGSGKAKIDGLKQAFASFAERLIPDNKNPTQKVRIALAPFSASVNLGGFAGDAQASKGSDSCVTERQSGTFTDSADKFFISADGTYDKDPTEDFPRDSGGKIIPAYVCPSTAITPLSDDRASLISKVNAFKPQGWTAGHLGAQWAWNLISDQWSWGGAKGSSYDDIKKQKLVKAVVLMTDGIFNTSYHGTKSSEQALSLCSAMKARGIQVFTIAFDTKNDPADKATLQACATSGAGYYANASNSDELEAAFNNFADKLSALRISK